MNMSNYSTFTTNNEEIKNYLFEKSTDAVKHSNSTLLSHLKGVANLLAEWGASEEIVHAGLFHSAYGTQFFEQAILGEGERAQLAALIGASAERIAHTFCMMDQASFLAAALDQRPEGLTSRKDGSPFPEAHLDLSALIAVWVANYIEQRPRLLRQQRQVQDEDLRRLKGLVSEPIRQAITRLTGPDAAQIRAIPIAGARRVFMVDDMVPEQLREELSSLADRNIWRYGWKAADSQTGHGFWHCHFGGGDENSLADCSAEMEGRALIAPILDLWSIVSSKMLKDHVPVRVYANAHTYGGDGHAHLDSTEHAEYYTTIYYAHRSWHANWAGETVFLSPDWSDVRFAAHPRPGRIVHFQGDMPHAARAPARDCPALRVVYVFKSRPRQLAPTADQP